jgi:hypothetical protein
MGVLEGKINLQRATSGPRSDVVRNAGAYLSLAAFSLFLSVCAHTNSHRSLALLRERCAEKES